MCIREVEFETLKGKTLINIECKGDSEIQFKDSENNIYHMYHEQDCCEEVYIKDICGNLSHLLDSPITMAECIVNEGNVGEDEWGTATWTFYKLATVKGYVTITWYGESNGYYSETVDFVIEESIKNKRTYDSDLLSKNVEHSNLLQLDKFNCTDKVPDTENVVLGDCYKNKDDSIIYIFNGTEFVNLADAIKSKDSED